MTFTWKAMVAGLRADNPTVKKLFLIASLAALSVSFIKFKFYLFKLCFLRYPFITDKNTIKYFNKSNTIIVEDSLKLRKTIKTLYGSAASFCSARDKRDLIREIKDFCTAGRNIIVVQRRDLCQEPDQCYKDFLDPLPALAEQFKYSLYIASLKEDIIPLYTGWLLNEDDSSNLMSVGKKALEELLLAIPSFRDSFKKFSKQETVEEMLNYYKLAVSNANGMLHCTAKYLANGTARGSIEYWKTRLVRENLSRCYSLNVIGFVWTPRTFGARVKLTKEELRVWDNIDEMSSELHVESKPQFSGIIGEDSAPDFAPVKGRGSRAHLTLGVAEDVPAVVTGQDLLQVVHFESEHRNWLTYSSSLGWLRDYGNGVWVLYSARSYLVDSMFGGVYSRLQPTAAPARSPDHESFTMTARHPERERVGWSVRHER